MKMDSIHRDTVETSTLNWLGVLSLAGDKKDVKQWYSSLEPIKLDNWLMPDMTKMTVYPPSFSYIQGLGLDTWENNFFKDIQGVNIGFLYLNCFSYEYNTLADMMGSELRLYSKTEDVNKMMSFWGGEGIHTLSCYLRDGDTTNHKYYYLEDMDRLNFTLFPVVKSYVSNKCKVKFYLSSVQMYVEARFGSTRVILDKPVDIPRYLYADGDCETNIFSMSVHKMIRHIEKTGHGALCYYDDFEGGYWHEKSK